MEITRFFSKRWYLPTRLHDVTTQKQIIILTPAKTSNVTHFKARWQYHASVSLNQYSLNTMLGGPRSRSWSGDEQKSIPCQESNPNEEKSINIIWTVSSLLVSEKLQHYFPKCVHCSGDELRKRLRYYILSFCDPAPVNSWTPHSVNQCFVLTSKKCL
jgi:hypothetical protein